MVLRMSAALRDDATTLTTPEPVQAAAPAPLPEALARILIVDDDDHNLFAMEKVLEDIGQVVTARSGEEALKQLLQHDFAVILLDVLMPGMDGYETAALIRARERSRYVPIIFLTAVNKDDAHMLRGYSMGAVDYVFKPVEPQILRSKVGVFVELFRKTQEVRIKAEHEQRLLQENFRVRTEKMMAERALRISEERQAVIIQSLPIALYAGEPGRETVAPQFISDNVEALCGFTARQFLESRDLWSSRIHPEDRDRVLQEFLRLRSAGSLAIEYRWRSADEKYRYFLDQAVLVRDEQGRPKEIFGTLLDVTERKQLELQLIQSQKMDAIGKLTGGIAHDFNNMLTVVIGSLDRLRRLQKDDPATLKRIDMALSGAMRCSDMTRQLLAFARRQPLRPQAVDLNDLVLGIADMVRRVLGEGIELVLEPGSDLWPATTDPTQIESALLNLVVNARDAMPEGGRLSLSTANVQVSERESRAGGDLAPGDYVMLVVRDTGVGIPAEFRDRVFEPFFTTKPTGRGTGLGLSIIYGFVKQSGGHIRLDTEVGLGTTFSIYLPRAASLDTAPQPRIAALEGVPRARDGEIVLAVEDDDTVRQIAVDALKDLGYSVFEAPNGRTALDVLHKEQRIDLLFTDFAMPGGINGRDLAVEAVAQRPQIKILLTSAYTEQLTAAKNPVPSMRFLSKPYREGELALAVRSTLDEG
jgi:PAS domain S-box-containing protein